MCYIKLLQMQRQKTTQTHNTHLNLV